MALIHCEIENRTRNIRGPCPRGSDCPSDCPKLNTGFTTKSSLQKRKQDGENMEKKMIMTGPEGDPLSDCPPPRVPVNIPFEKPYGWKEKKEIMMVVRELVEELSTEVHVSTEKMMVNGLRLSTVSMIKFYQIMEKEKDD